MKLLSSSWKTMARSVVALLTASGFMMPPRVDATVRVDDLHTEYDACVGKIRSAGLGAVVDQLDRSKHSFRIVKTDKTGNTDARSSDREDDSNGVGTGGYVTWNPSDNHLFPEGVAQDACAALYHEMQHISQYDTGTRPVRLFDGKYETAVCSVRGKEGNGYPIPITEVTATREENKYRATQNLPPRTHYCNVLAPLPPDGVNCDVPPPRPPPPAGGCAGGCSVSAVGATGRSAKSVGDPHLDTLDGVPYSFQAAGEFTALRSNTQDVVVQVRQIPWRDSRWVSVTSAVGVSVNGSRLTIESGQASLIVRLKGVSTTIKARLSLPAGGFIVPEGRGYVVGWPDGSLIRILPNVRGLDLSVHMAATRMGTMHGLLGPYTGNSVAGLNAKNGTPITAREFTNYHRLYRDFGDSWRITQSESLFNYASGESTVTYDHRAFPDPNSPKIPSSSEASARVLCVRAAVPPEALAGCILDVAMTGEAGFAVTTAAAMRPIQPASEPSASAAVVVVGTGGDMYKVYDASGKTYMGARMTNTPVELLPGAYLIDLIGGKKPITVREGQRASVAAGAVVVTGTGGDFYKVYDASGKTYMGARMTNTPVELLPGAYLIERKGVKTPVTVRPSEKAILR